MTTPGTALVRGVDGRFYQQSTDYAPPGSYWPDPTNVGTLPNVAREQVGDYVAHSGETIKNADIGRLTLQGPAQLRNVHARLTAPVPTSQSTITVTSPTSILDMQDCEVEGYVADGRSACVERMAIHARRSWYHHAVDGIDLFNPSADADLNSQFICCLVDELLVGPSLKPDGTLLQKDGVTHNDCVQVQGEGGALFDGCVLLAMADPNLSPWRLTSPDQAAVAKAKTYSYPHATAFPTTQLPRANGSVLALTPNTHKITRPVVLRRSLIGGGRRTIGAVAGVGINPGMLQLDRVLCYDKDLTPYGPVGPLQASGQEYIVVGDKSWLQMSGSFLCDANGVSTGVPIPVRVGIPG